ncbi:glycoside hydrolase family 15 protein [Stygiolobus caldivivus]|uniref:Glucan 1,3-alpha-glucosidase n=1 Tax=Stygiolobus caldivivus TaxID=2824673 RepID=A0A8D5U8I0_9CREN|nr:glycoside hydrolase family 15 protein [Stygiolobus caldivivus]BCU70985.1 glucan 1,3-alpha-glucosidase [Stygiolobus caldivivus]
MRVLSVGNGKLLVNLDELGRIIDLYYPYVGMENHTNGKPVRQYIFTDRLYQDTEWRVNLNYLNNTNIAEVKADINSKISLLSYDFTDLYEPIFYRVIKVYNKSTEVIRAKLIFLFDLDLYSNPYGDTAFFDPETTSIIHYKAKRYVGIKLLGIMKEFNEFTVGKNDVFEDVKDGNLIGKTIENGNVQSALALQLSLSPLGSEKAYLAIAFDRTLQGLRKLLKRVTSTEIESSFTTSYMFWKNWFDKFELKEVDDKIKDLFQISLLVIKNHMDQNGSIIASSDYSFVGVYGDSYTYCWPRDSAITAHALDLAGYGDLAVKHYAFISKLVSEEGFLFHKYNPDSTLASSWHPWLMNGKRIYPIQEDETALQVWAIAKHYEYYKDIDELVSVYKDFVKPAVRFMMRYIEDGLPKPSFDLWEERYGIHIYTVSTVYGALKSASKLVSDMGDEVLSGDMVTIARYIKEEALKRMVHNDRFIRRLDENGNKDLTVDASMYSPFFFEMVDAGHPIMKNTIKIIEDLLTVNGGIIRYENDYYRRERPLPNPWIITTLWVAQYYAEIQDMQKAMKYVKWVMDRALPTGLLPEQVYPDTLQSSSVMPLVWSHSEFIITLDKLITSND